MDERALLGPEAETYESSTPPTSTGTIAQVAFQIGGSDEPWTFCLDNVALLGGAEPPVYEPDTGPRVRVNQVGYLPDGPKGRRWSLMRPAVRLGACRTPTERVASGQINRPARIT